jgi:hypothetical protein
VTVDIEWRLAVLRGRISELAEAVREDAPAVADALTMAVEAIDEARLRAAGREPLPGHGDDAEQHPFVFGVEPGVGPDQ